MIVLKSKREIEIMKKAGEIAATALHRGIKAVKPGVTTREISAVVHDYIKEQGATPSFLGYGGFPAAACVSVNGEVIHGMPGPRKLIEGDIVSIDVGAIYEGYHGDTAFTTGVGRVSDEVRQLMDVAQECLKRGIAAARPGGRLGDIGHAVQEHAERFGFGVVRAFVGHGVGSELHEAPEVPNYGSPGKGIRLQKGMTIAIEPMINLGTGEVVEIGDGWTIVTADGKPSAHFEHTIAITQDGCEILTIPNWEAV